jgi:ABC-type multidrug transport system ATPase subunit/ABC-type multidrug transport system permease subunit
MIRFKLYFYQNNKLFKKVAVHDDYFFNLIVGSSPDADIQIDNNRISKKHLQLIYNSEKKLIVQDLNSTNGTSLNGIFLKPAGIAELKNKDKLEIAGLGGVVILIENEKSPISIEKKDILKILNKKGKLLIGRGADCDLILEGHTISRNHAVIIKESIDTYKIKDLDSSNGTFVNGNRIKGDCKITIKDKIFIGRNQISLIGETKDLNEELAISAKGIRKVYSNNVTALNKTDLSVPSKSLLAIMGPSGCGKSTLLKTLNGDAPSSSGKVYLFNLELTSNYNYLKTQIGYVPQDDIIHKELRVFECLYYTAKLRLKNLSNKEIHQKIDSILKELNIFEIKNNIVSEISGGQRKRVSIAVELLTDPLLLFLDGPTSPLDPQTVEDFLDILKRLAEKGTTVIMVTHKPEDLAYMDDVIFMAEGGNVVYYGDSNKYKDYFEVDNAVSVFAKISGKTSKYWIDKYKSPRPSSATTTSSINIEKKNDKSLISQFYWLTSRYFKIKTNDKINSLYLIIQAPIIACLICLIFTEISAAVPFITAISAIWFGTNNAAREIVNEASIYKRERMYNLDIFPYILSKVFVLSFFSIIQSAIFVLILFLHFSNSLVSLTDPFDAFLWMSFISISATFLGLFLSSIMSTTEKVMTIVPIILMPQIMLAGLVAKINNEFVEVISYFTLSRWGTEGFNIIQREIISSVPDISGDIINTKIQATQALNRSFHKSYHANFSNSSTIDLDITVVSVMTLFFVIFIFYSLKKKDSVSL